MKTQTAVEWLVKELNQKIDYIPINKWDEIRDIVQQAKEMEKEQIIDFQLYMSENDFISNHLWDFEDMAIKFLNSKKQKL